MKKLIIIFLALSALLLREECHGQGVKYTAGISYGNGAPTHTPTGNVSKKYIDLTTLRSHTYSGTAWVLDGQGIDVISGCSAPNYTPGVGQSNIVINNCTELQNGQGPELYAYSGSDWIFINEKVTAPTYTAGTGINITGTVISNTGDLSNTNELQSISLAGQTLTLSGGGGSVTIPKGGGVYIGGEGIVIDSPQIRIDTLDRVSFAASPTLPGGVGTVRWNDTDGTLEFGMKGGNVTQQVGQELPVLVKHADNSGLANGAVVYVVGSDGANKKVRLAKADAESTSANTFGVMSESATGGAKAFCTTFGLVRDINTASLTEGQMVWVSAAIAGAMTTTRPTAPNHAVQVGFCIRSHATQGVIFVSVQNGYELGELHDVSMTSPSTGQVLKYDTDKWINSVDYDSPLNNGFYRRNNLKYIDAYISKIASNTSSASIVLMGDSYIEQDIFPNQFKALLQEKLITGGPGFLQAKDIFRFPNTAGTPNSLSANGWVLRSMISTPMGKGLSMHSVVSTASSVPFYWLPQSQKSTQHVWNTLELWYFGTAGGATLSVEIDSVSVGSVNTSLLTGFQKATFSVATNKQHSVKVTASGAGAEILGFNCYTSGLNAIRVNAFGQTGAKVSHYLSVDTSIWNPQFRALSPTIVFVNLGTNNRSSGQSLSEFKTEMKTLVNRLKLAKSDIDICLIGQVDLSSSFGTPIAPAARFNDILREIALEDSIAYFDTDQIFGSYLKRTQNSKLALISGDGIHPTIDGGYVISNAIISAMAPFLRHNVREGILRTYGYTDPAAATGYTPNRIPIINNAGTLVTDIDFQVDAVNQSVIFAGNISAANSTFLSATVASPPLTGGALQVGGSKSSIGYMGFTTGQNLLNAGYTQGIRVDGAHSPVRFQTSNQGALTENWIFENFAAVNRDMPGTGKTVFRINQGVQAFQNGTRNDIFAVTTTINNTALVTTSRLGGIVYKPTVTATTGLYLLGFENYVGDNFLNSTSGNTAIGMSSASPNQPTAKLDITAPTGYNQLRLRTTYTPTGTADTNGNAGDVSWDADYIYIKTAAGWKRSSLSSF